MDVIKAIKQRISTRAFTDKPVDKSIIEKILEAARWAPSGVNTQPWRVHVLQGRIKDELSKAIIKARHAGVKQHPDYDYYPKEWREPYKERRKQCGIALYKAFDIQRDDMKRREKVWEDNYYFFGAPVGLIFSIDGDLEKGSWMDCAMFIQNVMLAAEAFELGTCPQASLAEYPDIVCEHLNMPTNRKIICGMAIGYPDKTAPVNNYRTEREEVDDFTTWL